MLPLALALVYLTSSRIASTATRWPGDRRHHEEMTRLHREAVAALEAARQSEQRYARAARHDDLTALPNRRLFGELLQRSMARAARATEPRYAVLFIDLDGFKLVNDSLGHLVGDQFLVAISSRLQTQLRPSDVLSRLGGDEFAVLIEDFATPDEVCAVTERLQRSLRDPIRPARARALRVGEHRHGARRAALPDGRRSAARRRHRDVSRQGGRPRRLPDLRSAHARLGGGAADARNRAAPRGRTPRLHARLSADRRAAVVARSAASRRSCAGRGPTAA